LGNDADPKHMDSNLASIIGILAKENWDPSISSLETKAFDIEEKITFNKLNAAQSIVEDYKIHHGRVDKIYAEFDKQGVNKSLAVLNSIRMQYVTQKNLLSADDLFFKVMELVTKRIRDSSNYVVIPNDELELCVNILVVDAFIRCKIFENPLVVSNVTP
jgi:hypothetical protein